MNYLKIEIHTYGRTTDIRIKRITETAKQRCYYSEKRLRYDINKVYMYVRIYIARYQVAKHSYKSCR